MSQLIAAVAIVFTLIITGCEQHTRATGATPASTTQSTDISQPKDLSILPGSLANNNSPKLVGIAPAGSTVSVYTNGTCSGAPAAVGAASAFQTTGITVTVADDSVTTFYVKSIGAVTSNCVGSVTYTEDSTAPATTASFSITPANGSTSTVKTPIITGTGAENGATIYLYSNAGCSSLIKSATVSGGAFSFSGFTLSGDGLRVFYYKIADSSGNTSACTNTNQSYTLDTSAPAAPTSWAMSSPSIGATSADTTPLISGTAAENTAVVKIYSDSSCSNWLNSGTVVAGTFSIGAFTVSTSTGLKAFYYKIQDTLGNTTACATTGLSYTLAAAATVTNVSSTSANGTYTFGQTIAVTVTFSKAVSVTGTPQLTLATSGSGNTVVNYSPGSPSNTTTTLTFDYTVAGGHSTFDLNYLSTTSLALNGGTILDSDGNSATLTLPAVTAANSLGGNKNIVVSTAAALSFMTGSGSPTPPNPDTYGTASLPLSANMAHIYTLKNTGNGSTISAITMSIIGTDASKWTISINNCTTPLTAGSSCTITVAFLAGTQLEGSYSAALKAYASTGETAINTMTGTVQCPTAKVVFQSAIASAWPIPGGCTDILAKAWGAGGAKDYTGSGFGGGGGYADLYKHVNPGDSITVYVGGGGASSSFGSSGGTGGLNGGGSGGGQSTGGGGGFSGFSQGAFYWLIAGGGGGGGSGYQGGPGGGTLGSNGTPGSPYYQGGEGGTQTGGGAGGQEAPGNTDPTITRGAVGVQYFGGAGGVGGGIFGLLYYSGGGGGGGYYGGGGGGGGCLSGGDCAFNVAGGAGGGGSSYTKIVADTSKISTATAAGGTTASPLNYPYLPGNMTDSDYINPNGIGGVNSGGCLANGCPGLVVIYPQVIANPETFYP